MDRGRKAIVPRVSLRGGFCEIIGYSHSAILVERTKSGVEQSAAGIMNKAVTRTGDEEIVGAAIYQVLDDSLTCKLYQAIRPKAVKGSGRSFMQEERNPSGLKKRGIQVTPAAPLAATTMFHADRLTSSRIAASLSKVPDC